ncbi:MAG: DNA-binding protein, partial [Candidatus Moranbacteria bacterium]|nr:DNA-binding protein [Candidatus Moranbacteria bacterium]
MYLEIREVAERLGVSQKVVRRLVAAGSLYYEKKGSAYR